MRRLKRRKQIPKPTLIHPIIEQSSNNTQAGEIVYERLTLNIRDPKVFETLLDKILKDRIAYEQHKLLPHLRRLHDDEEIEERIHNTEKKVVRQHYKQVIRHVNKLERKYGRDALYIKDPYLPTTWMNPNFGKKTPKEKTDAAAMKMRLENKTRFVDVYNYLYDNVSRGDPYPGGYEIEGESRQKPAAVIRVTSDFYAKMAKRLSGSGRIISERTIQKYMGKFCELGILQLLQKAGRNRDSLYAIGYWSEFRPGMYKVVRFLTKDMPGVEALLNFTAE